MSVFSANISHRSFYWQISLLCFVLGLLLAAAWNTARQLNRAGVGAGRTGFYYGSSVQAVADKSAQYETEIKKLRQEKTELENQLAKGTSSAGKLNEELQEVKFVAGLTEVEGPGVQVTLTDAKSSSSLDLSFLIHDEDVARVVNELKAAGAEAIAVNGQRVVSLTPVRCVGPVLHVNGVPTAPPYVIQAIGNAETLFNGLNMKDGVLDQIRRFDASMVKIETKKMLHLPAYAGSTTLRVAKLPKAQQPKESKREPQAERKEGSR